jgi:hypothetical protein
MQWKSVLVKSMSTSILHPMQCNCSYFSSLSEKFQETFFVLALFTGSCSVRLRVFCALCATCTIWFMKLVTHVSLLHIRRLIFTASFPAPELYMQTSRSLSDFWSLQLNGSETPLAALASIQKTNHSLDIYTFRFIH